MRDDRKLASMEGIGKKPSPVFMPVCIGLSVSLPAIAVLAFLIGPGFDNRFLDLDMALLELYTRHAESGLQLLGPYSRFGWNHPGPAYFYLLTPLYWLSGDCSTSLFFTARIINLLSAVGLLATIHALTRERGVSTAAWACLVTLLYTVYLGAEIVCSAWNPWIVVFPSALFVVCCAAGATGKPLFLPAAVAIGSFLVQTHVALLPLVGAMGVGSLVLLLCRAGQPPSQRGRWLVSLVLSLLALTLMWAPPLLEEMAHHPGNLSKLLHFFHAGVPGRTLGEAFSEVSPFLAWLPLLLIRSFPVRIPDFEYAFVGQAFALLELGLLPLVAWKAHRNNRRFESGLAALAAVGFLVSVWAASRVQGATFGYLLTWTSAVGLLSWNVLGGAALYRLKAAVRDRSIAFRPSQVAGLFLGLMGLIAATHAPHFFRQSLSVPGDNPAVKHLSQGLVAWIQTQRPGRPVIHFDWNNWSLESGILLQLHKAGIPFAVLYTWPEHGRGDWPLLLGKTFEHRPEDDGHIVFRRSDATMGPPWEAIASYNRDVAYGRDVRNAAK